MSNDATEKYKLFRNFMCNELGITRQDIERWTKEAVTTEVVKKLGQINVEEMIMEAISSRVRNELRGYVVSGSIGAAVAKLLAERLRVTTIDDSPKEKT